MLFWDRFYDACRLRGTSPNAVCAKIGLSAAAASHWKSGVMPKADALAAVCDVLDCSADYLLGRTDRVSSDPPELSPLELRLIRAFRDMSEIEQGVLIGRAEQEADREREARKKEA